MTIRGLVGPIRRMIYGIYDTALYKSWLRKKPGPDSKIEFEYNPKISIVVPTYNTDIVFFDKLIKSVKGQTYENWELVLIDDKSPQESIRERIVYHAKNESRITYKFLHINKHIAGATNEGIQIATGDFIGLLDHDDLLDRHALREVVRALNINKNLDFIYTDEDKVIGDRHVQPFLKPSLNRELLHSVNYITHFSVIRRDILISIGGENGDYNGAQDWELFLRVLRTVPHENVHHIPEILYSWRVHELSTSKDMGVKPYVVEAQKKAIEDDIRGVNDENFSVNLNKKYSGQWVVSYHGNSDAVVATVADGEAITDELLKSSAYIAIVKKQTASTDKIIKNLVVEAGRGDIGVVVTGGVSVVRRNLECLLGIDRASLVGRLSRLSISTHIYRTTRYNLPEVIDFEVAIVESSKLRRVVGRSGVKYISAQLGEIGFGSLFIPREDALL